MFADRAVIFTQPYRRVDGRHGEDGLPMAEMWNLELINVKRGEQRITRRQGAHVNPDDREALRMWLIDLAVEHGFERRDRVQEWIGDYALHVCLGFTSTPHKRFRAVK